MISIDGTAAICPRIESKKRVGDAGWLHKLNDTKALPPMRLIVPIADSIALPNWTQLATECRRAIDPGRLFQLAESLGLSTKSLMAVGIGWSSKHQAWTFPMSDAQGTICGIRLRGNEGRKWAIKGSKNGLFWPNTWPEKVLRLFIVEGATDVAALHDLGYPTVIGRPSCLGGTKPLCTVIKRQQPAAVVIISDNDEPGQRGANNLAKTVKSLAAVRIVIPPAGIKDVRAWLRAGATHESIQQAISRLT